MKVTDLNTDILFEKSMKELTDDFAAAKKELNVDINDRITLDEVKKFIQKYKDFAETYNIKKKRITEIEKKGKAVVKYLQARIDKMRTVEVIKPEEVEPLQDYLDDFKIEVDVHVDIQKQKYSLARRAK